ncbi:MAG: B12-binding domain-containing radical SAM protein [Candidatus Omnitrophica bacterium]|nr:B12-binding domain-containing radical SAM protein [Candidatus Omnitrophota bacterium]
MKVLFVYTNINGFHEDCYSIGLASIVAMTRQSGHEAKMVTVVTKEEYQKVLEAVNEFEPKIVGFSSVSSQFHFVKEIAALIKERYSDVITVCGGVHPTINQTCILETKSLDGIFIGESELSFAQFLEKIEQEEPYKDTDNFAWADNGKLVINKCKPLVSDLDKLPYPDKDIHSFKETLEKTGVAPFFFSRGCPYLCTYCSNHALAKVYGFHSNPTRYRSPESSVREIEEVMEKFSISSITIGDDIFGINKKWRTEFLQKYKDRIKIKFNCLLRVNVVDDEFIRLLKEAGCYRISFGVESGNDYIRNKVMKRQMKREQIVNAFALVRKYGLETTSLNIIGVPGETEEMIKDTIKLNREIRPTYSGINIFYPYKGTELGDYCFEQNLVNRELYDSFSSERRDTVLNYPVEQREMLVHYRENWEKLVYPFDLKRTFLNSARKTVAWKYLRSLKRLALNRKH